MNEDPFAPVSAASPRSPNDVRLKWISVLPVPANVPPACVQHPTLGAPSNSWVYTDAAGKELGYVLRFEPKTFRPLTLWRNTVDGRLEWRWESWPPPRPLYGLQKLTERPSAPVVICEGEKCADAAARLLPGFVAITSPGGSKSACKANWSPLKGRSVTVWPDNDAAGREYARQVVKLASDAGTLSVATVSPPPDAKIGWDAADALRDGWSAERATELVAAAVPVKKIADNKTAAAEQDLKSEPDAAPHGRRRTPQRDILIGLTEFDELWHDGSHTACVSFTVGDHREHWPVHSRAFRRLLSQRFFEETGGAIGGQALEDGLRILEAHAVNEGPLYERFNRTGAANGKMYLDLGDATWRAIEITATGWRLVENPPLKFLRSPSIRALPEPEAGSLIEELWQFLNVASETDRMLVVGWILAALRHRGPYPILVINGEAGTGKSTFSRLVRSLVDPRAAPIRRLAKDVRDLLVSANNSWVQAFDNLSSVGWAADDLSALATGSGLATRMLHTDSDEMIFEAARPIIINGIPRLTDAADLADRAVTIHLRPIPDVERRPEDELWAEFEQARPRIFGAVLDALSRAFGNIGNVKLERTPRMADFVKWVTAAEPGLGWEPGAFLQAYLDNRRDVSKAALESDSVAVAILKMFAEEPIERFEGTCTELLPAINRHTEETTRKTKSWPQNATALGNRIRRAAPLLRDEGYIVEYRHSGTRTITIIPPKRN